MSVSALDASFKPFELAPEWLTESPITFDDLRCTSYPATLWRVSLPSSPATPGATPICRKSLSVNHRRDSVASTSSSSSSSPSFIADVEELDKAGSAHSRPRSRSHSPGKVAPEAPPRPETSSFLFYHDDDQDGFAELHVGRWQREDDEATLNELGPVPTPAPAEAQGEEDDPSPIDPFFNPQSRCHSTFSFSPVPSPSPSPAHVSLPSSSPTPERAHSRGSSFDCASPWFMHVDAGALAALDDQLLQSPVDAFADMCYARAVQLPDGDPSIAAGGYSWRRFSRLRPLSPFSDIREVDEPEPEPEPEHEPREGVEDAESDSSSEDSEEDEDEEQLTSPEAHARNESRPRVYSPTPLRNSHHPAHPRHYHRESDGSIRFGSQVVSPTALSSLSNVSKPLPLLPPPSPSPPSPSPPSPEQSPSQSQTPSQVRSRSQSDPRRTEAEEQADLRGAAASSSPPPPMFLPSPAVSQAQLALLFGAPPRPSESVHFFPASATPVNGNGSRGGEGRKGKPRRGGLKISTNTGVSAPSSGNRSHGPGSTPLSGSGGGGGGGTWFQRGLRAIRA